MISWFFLLFGGLVFLVSGLVCLIIAVMAPLNFPLMGLGCILVFLAVRMLEASSHRKAKRLVRPQKWPKVEVPQEE